MLRKWFGKKDEPPAAAAPPPPKDEAPAAADAAEKEAAPERREPEKRSPWSLFRGGLEKTRKGLRSLFGFRRSLDAEYLSEIEEELYNADFGPEAVGQLVSGPDGLRAAWKEKKIERVEDVRDYLRGQLKAMLARRSNALREAESPPTVILVAGVNGTGKTTSIAKLTKRLHDQGHRVVLAAADTFRAAAVEQLRIWSQRIGVEIVTGEAGADPASVAYRGAEAAVAQGAGFLVVDTAGRLHTQKNLMRELEKIRAVLAKKIPGAPHESLLVIDATTGQNALNQARDFSKAIDVTGIVLAKLDGTAKGGIAVTINNTFDIPVKFVGLGEGIDDLEPFDVDRFVDALLS
jgi:fused signal recognition particle receptor